MMATSRYIYLVNMINFVKWAKAQNEQSTVDDNIKNVIENSTRD